MEPVGLLIKEVYKLKGKFSKAIAWAGIAAGGAIGAVFSELLGLVLDGRFKKDEPKQIETADENSKEVDDE